VVNVLELVGGEAYESGDSDESDASSIASQDIEDSMWPVSVAHATLYVTAHICGN
jgi:hypothetical protein